MLPDVTNSDPNPDGTGLTRRQKTMIELMVYDGLHRTVAAEQAGFSQKSAKQAAYKVMRKKEAQGYLVSLMLQQNAEAVVQAMHQVQQLSTKAKSEYVKLEASKDILDRNGVGQEKDTAARSGAVEIHIDLGGGGSEKPQVSSREGCLPHN